MQFLFGIAYLVAALADFALALKARDKGSEASRLFGNCIGGFGLVSLTYLVSIMVNNWAVATTANMLSFCLTAVSILYMLCFFLSLAYTNYRKNKVALWTLRAFIVLTSIDLMHLVLNPFTGHVATYTYIGVEHVPHYLFEAHVGYLAHLGLCYAMLAFGFTFMVYRVFRVPRMYRSPLVRTVLCVVAGVAFNAIYLLAFAANEADVALLTYSILGCAIYFSAFVYGDEVARSRTSKRVLETSSQPVVIFDYKSDLFFFNSAAKRLFGALDESEEPLGCEEFAARFNLERPSRQNSRKLRFYWTPKGDGSQSYICDYQVLSDATGRRVARTFVFTNNTLNIDQLTGYLTERYFTLHEIELARFEEGDVFVAVCDLNQLALLNNALGYSRGDDAIALQAAVMRKHLPETTVFVRLHDAKLAAICYGLEREDIKQRLEAANADLGDCTDFNMKLRMDFSVNALREGETLTDTASRSVSVLETRKLLDENSRSSGAIDSLIQMLAECDDETEGHVQRTRILGDSLAFQLGLSDYERDQLSLLCLFHDVGKVGIPAHILNKPARLTDAEYAIMKEHVQKGYRIARATAGLEIVAEPILHHHESWDGSGYPDGLQHEAIPILARIIAVIDAYDAMVSDRPYRSGMPVEEALTELRRSAGKQFDPYIVDTFVRMMGEQETVDKLEGVDEEVRPEEETSEGVAATVERIEDAFESSGVKPSKIAMLSPMEHSCYVVEGDDDRIVEVDKAFEHLTGYTAYDVEHLNLTQNDLIFEEDREAYWQTVRKLNEETGTACLEHRLRRKDGTGRYVYCTGYVETLSPVRRAHAIVSDITDSLSTQHQVSLARNRAMMSFRRLEETIRLDPMTGILNKAAFRTACERELIEKGQRCALVMFDVDNFKHYNDTYGHPAGDELLERVAEALGHAAGDGVAGRVGGDEFCCLLKFKGDSSLADMRAGIDAFWARLTQQREALDVSVTLSAGAAWPEQGSADFDELYKRADDNLYRAKRAGKNRVSIGEEE